MKRMKYKNLTKEQILISLDRLTRFKSTGEKYRRVFGDIILSNLIEPRFKKADLDALPPFQLRDYAVEILNASIENFSNMTIKNYSINERLKDYENTIFVVDTDTEILLDNKIDYFNALDLIEDNAVVNLRWLKSLLLNEDLINNRTRNCLKFPIEKVLVVEGLTEETLLPVFGKFLGFDFYKEGIQIIPAGGKNQVVKLYYKLSGELKLPIFLLFDKDAEENLAQIRPKLRKKDKIHLVSCGEFEDLLPKSLIVKAVNKELSNFASITTEDLLPEMSEVENLENIFKEKGLHEFKKADFAKLVKENITDDSDISGEIREIIEELRAK